MGIPVRLLRNTLSIRGLLLNLLSLILDSSLALFSGQALFFELTLHLLHHLLLLFYHALLLLQLALHRFNLLLHGRSRLSPRGPHSQHPDTQGEERHL